MNLHDLISMSRRYGSNPELVLAGGGNTSVKDAGTLYVKSSGSRLSDIGEEGFVALDRGKLSQILKKTYPSGDREREAEALGDLLEARLPGSLDRRPSVEALLHHLFPQRYVLHIHPALFNGLTCSRDGKRAAVALFSDKALWIPASRPGTVLARLCQDHMKSYREATGRDTDLVLLENHGVFIAGNSLAQVDRIFEEASALLLTRVKKHPDCTRLTPSEAAASVSARIERITGGKALAVSCQDALRLTADEPSLTPLLKPFTPDHIVYCGATPTLVAEEGQLEKALESRTTQKAPSHGILLLPGTGAFALGRDAKEAETAAALFEDAVKIAVYSENFGGPSHLNEDLIAFITDWEAESYRKSLHDKG